MGPWPYQSSKKLMNKTNKPDHMCKLDISKVRTGALYYRDLDDVHGEELFGIFYTNHLFLLAQHVAGICEHTIHKMERVRLE
jgi:hypothetical protein